MEELLFDDIALEFRGIEEHKDEGITESFKKTYPQVNEKEKE